METELKFRAWHPKREEMYEVFSFAPDYVFKNTLDGVGNPGVPDERKDVELMQFTGLSDSNGKESKEVYGGDILYNLDRKEYQEVVYNKQEAMWDVRYSHGEQRRLSEAISNLNTVAGNIYQNPYLLC